jgi:glycosyltransferase involved in cell wall biosynthesis
MQSELEPAAAHRRWIAPAVPGERERLASGRPKLSIVTPSFNQSRFLEQTIRSVLDQGYPNLEYIIVDGGSSDGSVDIIRRYAHRLSYWVSERDLGQTDALNKGFALATGDIVAWVNSDDFYYPGAFAAAVAAFQADPGLGFVYGRGNRVNESGDVIREFEATRPFDLEVLVYGVDYILQPSTFMRRQALHAVGPFDPALHYAFDWELWMRLGKRFPARMLDRIVAAGREYPSAKTFTGGFARVEEIRRIVSRHTGKELSIGYLAYHLNTAVEAMPRAELASSPLREAMSAAAIVSMQLLSLDLLRDGGDRYEKKLEEIPPYPDGWAGPDLRLRRAVPDTASFVCLSGVHQEVVARIIGPLALQARLDDRPLGVAVVVKPGPFRVYWPLRPKHLQIGDDGAGNGGLTVITACGLLAAQLGHKGDPRVLSFQFRELSFEDAAPQEALVVRPDSESAAEEAWHAYQRACFWPASSGEEVPAFADGWAGPELRLRRAVPETAAYVCLTGVHRDVVARVVGPLSLRARLDDQLLGVAIVARPGPFRVYWPLPPQRLRLGEASLIVRTGCGLSAAHLGSPTDPRVLSFQFGGLSFEDAAPRGAYVVRSDSDSAAEEAVRVYRRTYAIVFRIGRLLKRTARRLGFEAVP